MKNSNTFEALLKEKRTFNPKEDFIEQANIKSRAIYQKVKKDNEKFWETFANELHWFRKWKKTLSWKPPFAQWFIGGKKMFHTTVLTDTYTLQEKIKQLLFGKENAETQEF